MPIIQFDPEALRAEYSELLARAEKIKRVLDLLPDIQALAIASPELPPPPASVLPSAGGNGLRSVSRAMLESLSLFISGWEKDRFTVPEVLDWLHKGDESFDPEKERDNVTAGLRHFLGDAGPLVILIPGVGRRPQVYGIKSKILEDASARREAIPV